PFPPPDVIVDGAAHLADGYVPDDDAKLDFYRRLARASRPGEIALLRDELRDRFGPPPEEAERLLTICELRALGAPLGLEMVLVKGDEAAGAAHRGPRSGAVHRRRPACDAAVDPAGSRGRHADRPGAGSGAGDGAGRELNGEWGVRGRPEAIPHSDFRLPRSAACGV